MLTLLRSWTEYRRDTGKIGCCHSRKSNLTPDSDYERGRHLAIAAFLAMAFRSADDNFAALALPPFLPPSLPKATEMRFFPASGSSSGVPSICSPIARSTTRRAFAKKSRALLERLGMGTSCHGISSGASGPDFKLTHYH